MNDNTQLQNNIQDLLSRVTDLERKLSSHGHTGNDDQRIDIGDLVGLIPVVSAAPTHTPRDFSEQLFIYRNGSTYRFYWHDGTGWRYATGT